MWEEGEGDSGVVWDGDKRGVVGVGVNGGDAEQGAEDEGPPVAIRESDGGCRIVVG